MKKRYWGMALSLVAGLAVLLGGVVSIVPAQPLENVASVVRSAKTPFFWADKMRKMVRPVPITFP